MNRPRRRRSRGTGLQILVIIILTLIAAALAILAFSGDSENNGTQKTPGPGSTGGLIITPSPAPLPTPEPTPTPLPEFVPAAVTGTYPDEFGIESGIMVDGVEFDSYQRSASIDFSEGADYTELEGIITFRGNNFRDGASYGAASVKSKKFNTEPWEFETGSLKKMYGEGSWTGSGWTGQPLLVKWPEQTKRIMNMYDSAKQKKDLVEAIYATMDGNIYFLDIETGEKTRDSIKTGFPFKGAGALDPRGIPMLYLGSGDDSPLDGGKGARAFIYSLVTGEKLLEFGAEDPFAWRGFHAYDSSPLVDAETDTLVYPGENGILYTMKLNTQYDENAGILSISPSEQIKWRYRGARSGDKYWLGIEDSAVIWRSHAIFSDNGGHLMCLDLNRYKVEWVQNVLDDTNCTPVLELEDGHPYVYTSTSFHAGWRAEEGEKTVIPVWKIDAVTGEIVWKTEYMCGTVKDVSGGVQGTLAVGKNKLSDLIFVPVSRNPSTSSGKLVALDKNTGSERWVFEMEKYPWSSPVAVYDEDGNGYIIQCNQAGNMYLLDGLTGELLDTLNLGANIEASPAVYGNTIVVGTRGNRIFGVTLE